MFGPVQVGSCRKYSNGLSTMSLSDHQNLCFISYRTRGTAGGITDLSDGEIVLCGLVGSSKFFKVEHKYTDSLEASKPDLQFTAVKTV